MTIAVRRARPADLNDLERLENRVFDGDRLSRRSLREYISNPRTAMFTAEYDGAFAGYALVAFRKRSSIARLYSIAVVPEFFGQTIGANLMLACETTARDRGCKTLHLEVREDNPAAIGLYRSRNYRQFGTYEEFYEDGMTALRFERQLFD